jgi:hypothetical protein
MDSATTKGSSRPGILPSSSVLRIFILAAIALIAAVSTCVGVKEAAFSDPGTEGIDFQWSGAHLLSQHEDPWKLYINHQDKGKVILGQQPNYLAELFLLLQPLGQMPFQQAVKWWCGLNLFFTGCILYLVRKMFLLDRDHTLLIAFLLMASMPFRVTLHIGQQSLFVLLMLCITFYAQNPMAKGLALGVSYSKYSFAPIIVVMLLMKRRIGVILISSIPPLVGLLLAWRMLGGSFKSLTLEPFAVAKMAMGPGAADIMTPLEILLRSLGFPLGVTFSIPAILGLVAAVVAAIWIGRNKRMDEKLQFAVALILTLMCLKHVIYDFVVLVVPIAAAVMAPRSKARSIVLLCGAHFWFLTPIIQRLAPEISAMKILTYSLLLLVMGIATSLLQLNLTARSASVPVNDWSGAAKQHVERRVAAGVSVRLGDPESGGITSYGICLRH